MNQLNDSTKLTFSSFRDVVLLDSSQSCSGPLAVMVAGVES